MINYDQFLSRAAGLLLILRFIAGFIRSAGLRLAVLPTFLCVAVLLVLLVLLLLVLLVLFHPVFNGSELLRVPVDAYAARRNRRERCRNRRPELE